MPSVRTAAYCLLATSWFAALAIAVAPASAYAAGVTIYRCTDAQGRLTLRDTPCRRGEHQQTRAMLRPTEPAPRPRAPAVPAAAPPSYVAPQRVLVIQPPRPLYECVNDDGGRYTSDSGEGRPRWVPLWTLGTPVWNHHDGFDGGRFDRGGVQARVEGRFGNGPFNNGRFEVRLGDHGSGRPGLPLPGTSSDRGDLSVRGVNFGPAYPAGTWVRDACYPLPGEEVCSRLRDRRYELDRRYNSALQSERAQISTEQRGIDARLNNDCGAY